MGVCRLLGRLLLLLTITTVGSLWSGSVCNGSTTAGEGATTNGTGATTTSHMQRKGNTTKGKGATTDEKEKTKEGNPNTTKMLLESFRQAKPPYEKDFYNTTMELNRNYSARLHVDKNNHGPSFIIALGGHIAAGSVVLEYTRLD